MRLPEAQDKALEENDQEDDDEKETAESDIHEKLLRLLERSRPFITSGYASDQERRRFPRQNRTEAIPVCMPPETSRASVPVSVLPAGGEEDRTRARQGP